ncbi:cryptochrome/photolyase family protein [uncultured Rubinisphaera sp.]|uniref:cryptochrome/photolyase family protein n=1 Tax=uncultured Rubinisphaera sp. TaxID=1678686 RepID=UPI0030D9ACDA
MRNLILILGDQLDHNSAVFDDFESAEDSVWMAEVAEEATHVWCHKLRIAMFFSAMRHFRDELREKEISVHYHQLPQHPSKDSGSSFTDVLKPDVERLQPQKLILVHPGDHRVLKNLHKAAKEWDIPLEIREDRHFYCTLEEFEEFAADRKELRLEYFYRMLRKREKILVNDHGEPEGGEWNLDHENREAFPKSGPKSGLKPKRFRPDDITKHVIEMVSTRFKDHPGSLDHFDIPVTRSEALKKLNHFIKEHLPNFGNYEDAMWTDETTLYHSQLSACLNLKLLNPRDCVDRALKAWQNDEAPLNSVEGFIRQILGWREFVRCVYWSKMPKYESLNHFETKHDVPQFFWDGQTDMECVRQSMKSVINHGYSHHIHRLMVLGNLSMLAGVDPYKFHEWHMAMYLDAIDWVSLPNTLGMSQYGDGGIVGSKPYCSSGNYINKMSNFCKNCRYNYKEKTGEKACPITTLYWDFLDRNYDKLKDNPRMNFQVKNLEKLRKKSDEIEAVRDQAEVLKKEWFDN